VCKRFGRGSLGAILGLVGGEVASPMMEKKCNALKCRFNLNLYPSPVKLLSEAVSLDACSLVEIPDTLDPCNCHEVINHPHKVSQNGHGQANNQRNGKLLLRSEDN